VRLPHRSPENQGSFLAGLTLLDRIDIHIEVPAVPFRELAATTGGTSSAQMRESVVAARQIQHERFAGSPTRFNGQMAHRQIRAFCQLDDAGMNLLRATMTELGLSARAHDKILRLARTIADLDDSRAITSVHISEAINYRMLDRNLWS
jgi:magnesium chelatase family protein